MVTLTRVPVKQPLTGHSSDVLADAALAFGYHPGGVIATNDADLRRAMQQLDIRPFKQEEVDAYKKEQVWRMNAAYRRYNIKAGISLAVTAVVWIVAIAWSLTAQFDALTAVLAGLGALALGITVIFALGSDFSDYYSWERKILSQTTDIIPEYVLQSALDLKRLCPVVQLLADVLVEQRTAVRGDPFLVAKVAGGPMYYIEVWTEPQFTQQREL